MRELGQTIVMVTHDPGAAAYADRVVLLADGRVAGEIDQPDRASVTDALQDLAAQPMKRVCAPSSAGVARRPARLLLTGLAVLVASFVVYATVLAQQITERTVLDGLSGTPAGGRPGRRAAATSTTGAARRRSAKVGRARRGRGGRPGRARAARSAASTSASPPIPAAGRSRSPTVTAGHATRPGRGEIAVSPRTADRMGLPVGTTVTVNTGWDEDGKPIKPGDSSRSSAWSTARDDFGFTAYAPQPPCPR